MKILIVEDELAASQLLESMLTQLQVGEPIETRVAHNISEAEDHIQDWAPDLVFLDMHIGDVSGFELFNVVPDPAFKTIIVSAFDEYAIEAIKHGALDYLLKPINPMELKASVEKIAQTRKAAQVEELHAVPAAINPNIDFIVVPSESHYILIRYADLEYLEANGNYTIVKQKNENKLHLITKTLKEFDHILKNPSFFRTHRKYIVNLNEIKGFSKGQSPKVFMNSNKEIALSRSQKEELFKYLGIKF